ncbi:hypothetical protein SCHPADRAFT_982081 [Schizopora paradoxa]|uniref:DUF6533 domain-containing protein n=1 Tax=Schizopora paradoxa TaxID=27342 RepID=A0A0H2R9D5_9AGAM|nr:hypothetical protein SCHPADRAFT_982081 [Schizopora paradoxa]
MNSSVIQAEIQAVEILASDIRSYNYVVAASATFLVYDILITYSDEVEFIWGSMWSFGKACYVVNRYGTLLVVLLSLPFYFHPNPPVELQGVVFLLDMVRALLKMSSMIIVLPIQLILCLRAYALHAGNQAVKWLLALIILESYSRTVRQAQLCCEIADYSLSSAEVKFGPAPLGGFSCLLTVSSLPTKAGLINYATQTAFDGIIFLVSAVKLVKLMLTGRSQLAWLLLQDSLVYLFLLIFGALVTFLLFLFLPSSHATLKEITSSFMISMASTIASRLILNLRGYVHSPRLDSGTLLTAANPENYDSTQVGEIDFAENWTTSGMVLPVGGGVEVSASEWMEMETKPADP